MAFQYALVIVLAALLGGMLPLVRAWSDRALHLFVAAAAGVFLGVTFLHLFPEFVANAPSRAAWLWMALSIVVLFAIERVGFDQGVEQGTHGVLSYATFTGLALHSVAAGYALGVGADHHPLERAIFLALVSHKSVEAFSLATVLLLAGRRRPQIVFLVILLAMMVPLGSWAGHRAGGVAELAIPLALATGTFIYVSLCDLLPEVFHHREDGWLKVVVVLVGVLSSLLLPTH